MNDRDMLMWELRRADRHLYLDKPRERAGAWSTVDRFLLRTLVVLAVAIIAVQIWG